MSLNNIKVPAIVLQDLYSKALVDKETGNAVSKTAGPGKLSFLGDNGQRIAIIVNDAGSIYLPDNELNFLLGILSACKLSMADVALMNYAKNPSVNYTMISEELSSEKIFLFGVDPVTIGLPMQFPHHQVQKYNSQVYLSSPALKVLENDKAEKTKLWGCLKQVFSLV